MTEEEIRNKIIQAFDERLANPNEPPDITITEDIDQFHVKIVADKRSMHTGIGGLKMFLKALAEKSKGAEQFLKVQYNGVILTREQAVELFDKVKNYNNEQG